MRDETGAELRAILQATRIFTQDSFALAGQGFRVQPQPGAQLPQNPVQDPVQDPQGARHTSQNPLVQQLAQQLYVHCYCRRFDGRLLPPPQPDNTGDELVQALSAANATRERWEAGWQIQQVVPGGQIAIHKNGRTRMIWPGEFIAQDGPGVPPRVGGLVNVYAPREARMMQPGFYFAFGDSSVEQNDIQEAVRFYWNIQAEGAPELMRKVTGSLNRFQVPFRFKCASQRSLFFRIDSAVLYVSPQHYHITAELAADIYGSIQPQLQPETPLFTKRLAPGLAFAEEPGTGESFGMSRCRLLAEGIWNGWVQGERDERGRLEAVKRQFESNGIAFDRPYLRPGAVDHYEWPEGMRM